VRVNKSGQIRDRFDREVRISQQAIHFPKPNPEKLFLGPALQGGFHSPFECASGHCQRFTNLSHCDAVESPFANDADGS
jgi:hypothetical protein